MTLYISLDRGSNALFKYIDLIRFLLSSWLLLPSVFGWGMPNRPLMEYVEPKESDCGDSGGVTAELGTEKQPIWIQIKVRDREYFYKSQSYHLKPLSQLLVFKLHLLVTNNVW